MKVLMIDVGGTHVKLMVTGSDECRRVPSGPHFTPARLVREVRKATADWSYKGISLGLPCVVADGRPAIEPGNLGRGWVKFDYDKAFQTPVRIINDAAMQALGSYNGGRMLFFGLGTSTGSTLIVDDVIVPLEVGCLYLPDGGHFGVRLTNERRRKDGKKKWLRALYAALDILRDLCQPDYIVLGGGNAEDIKPIPDDCWIRDNSQAFIGASRLWPGADMLVKPRGTSWHIVKGQKAAPPKPKRKAG